VVGTESEIDIVGGSLKLNSVGITSTGGVLGSSGATQGGNFKYNFITAANSSVGITSPGAYRLVARSSAYDSIVLPCTQLAVGTQADIDLWVIASSSRTVIVATSEASLGRAGSNNFLMTGPGALQIIATATSAWCVHVTAASSASWASSAT
jgi:hypothetical protein